MLFGQLVIFLLEGSLFDLMLNDFALDDIQFGRHGVDFRADHRARLIDEVNCFVRQETVGNISIGQGCCCNQCRILNFYAVINFIAFLQAAENGDGVLHSRFTDHDRLETAFQCRIFFNILAVLVQRGCTDAVQLTARQHWLEQIACIHSAVGFARADNGMQLIDEQNNIALALFDLIEDSLQAFLKFAAVFCTCDERAHIQRENRLVFQRTRDIAAHNALCKSLGDGSLADTRLTDQNRIVLGFARQNPNHISDLIITADDRVHFFLSRALDQIRAVFFQCVIGILRGIGGDTLIAAHGGQRL